jgi:hypothetical protein
MQDVRVSHLPTKITVKDRKKQYPGIQTESGGKYFALHATMWWNISGNLPLISILPPRNITTELQARTSDDEADHYDTGCCIQVYCQRRKNQESIIHTTISHRLIFLLINVFAVIT